MGSMTTGSARDDATMMMLVFLFEGILGGLLGTWLGLQPWWAVTKSIYLRVLVMGIPLAAVGAAITALILRMPKYDLVGAVMLSVFYALVRGFNAAGGKGGKKEDGGN